VLAVPREALDSLLATDPAASRYLLDQVAARLRTAGGPSVPHRPAQPKVVAVVGLHPGAATAHVAETLVERMATHLRVVATGVVDPDGLDRAEREHDRVVLVAHSPDSAPEAAWRDFCLRQADAVVLVADHGTVVPPAALDPAPVRQPDLVLTGSVPSPEERAAWVAATDAWQLTLVEDPRSGGLRALADRLAGRSLGLVLAGGGARAFSHVGVLREL